ncbi:MAG: adenylyltransferase/cytidyltransferase family protein [Clostridia bacterium]|nr:adenylyltransferase/cytidyltransferase family protein [Clostridia bacterium]
MDISDAKVRKRPSSPPENRSKAFGLGIVAGRFQPLHLGHCDVIDTALRLCRRVGVMIGSSQESRTRNNPLSYEERSRLLRQVYRDSIEICPLPDIGVGNTELWGMYLLKTAELYFGERPEVIISGEEDRRLSWFGPGSDILELQVIKARKISATDLRKLLAARDTASAALSVPTGILPALDYIAYRVADSADGIPTESL